MHPCSNTLSLSLGIHFIPVMFDGMLATISLMFIMSSSTMQMLQQLYGFRWST